LSSFNPPEDGDSCGGRQAQETSRLHDYPPIGRQAIPLHKKLRFQVGLISTSLMQTCCGMLAMKAMVLPTSSGCSIRAFSLSLGCTGRRRKISVATSPGQRAQARMPFLNSSMLKEWVSATTACLV